MPAARITRRTKVVRYTSADVLYALGNAAEFLEHAEFPDGTGAQEAANRKAAQIIKRVMAARRRRPETTHTAAMPERSGMYG